jgi:hypothetical protein
MKTHKNLKINAFLADVLRARADAPLLTDPAPLLRAARIALAPAPPPSWAEEFARCFGGGRVCAFYGLCSLAGLLVAASQIAAESAAVRDWIEFTGPTLEVDL